MKTKKIGEKSFAIEGHQGSPYSNPSFSALKSDSKTPQLNRTFKFGKKSKKYFALSQIFLIVMSIFAFSFMLSESVVVSGRTSPPGIYGNFGDTSDVGPGVGPDPKIFAPKSERDLQELIYPGSGLPFTPSGAAGLDTTIDFSLRGWSDAVWEWWEGFDPMRKVGGVIASQVGGLAASLVCPDCGPIASGLLNVGFSVAAQVAWAGMFGVGWKVALSQDFIVGAFMDALVGFGIGLAISSIMDALFGVDPLGAILGGCQTKTVRVTFTCHPWQAPSGGGSCGRCNEDSLKPCTEYRCESMGQACNLINKNTNNPLCMSTSEESTPAVISSGEIIMTQDYEFQNQEDERIEIRRNDGECIQEFTPVLFTLETSKPAQCKWDFDSTKDFGSMAKYLAEGTQYTSKHTLAVEGLSLSILQANNIHRDIIEGITGDMNIYVRCKDSFGNINLNPYTVNFCINSKNDITPVSHSLTTTHPRNQEVLSYESTETDFTMWMNEPAECKYSDTEGKNYNEMTNSMTCKTDLTEIESMGWPCSTKLTNIKDESTFYIKCKDQPWETDETKRNINVEDFVYQLHRIESKLNIDSISILYDNIETELNQDTFTEIKGGGNIFSIELGVKTSEGINNGVSLCSYQWRLNDWIYFLDTGSQHHKQKFQYVTNGNYNIPIYCQDGIGNKIIKNAKFVLDVDNDAPIAVRTYHQSGKLNVITNEQAKCYFSFDNLRQCNFNIEDKEDMETGFKTSHSTDWIDGKTYYIKCEDAWENQNSGCAIKVITS